PAYSPFPPPPRWWPASRFHRSAVSANVSVLVGPSIVVLQLRPANRCAGTPRVHPAARASSLIDAGGVLVLLSKRQGVLPDGSDLSRSLGQGPAETAVGIHGRIGQI